MTLGEPGESVALGVYASVENRLSPNSYSKLAIPISEEQEIYVLLREQGEDKTRTATFEALPKVFDELQTLATLPESYRVEDQYAEFFSTFFDDPLEEQSLQRFPGLQDRDILYGYFRSQSDTSYEGINIKVSHPVYAEGEATREFARLRKADYLGQPYEEQDLLFFLIEDNAVYLLPEYSQQFGTFSGTESFDGIVEVLNEDNEVLLETIAPFKGWER